MDIRNKLNGCSITTGITRYRDLCYLPMSFDESVEKGYLSDTLLVILDADEWCSDAFRWLACSGTVCKAPSEKFLLLGIDGQIFSVGGGNKREETPVPGIDTNNKKRGLFREIRGIANGRAYAVGTGRMAYIRIDEDTWHCIDHSAQVFTDTVTKTDTCFESIDGFSEQDIYTVGWEGEIWHYDGERFQQITSPTNLALYKVRCAADGYVYACGQLGTLLRGRNEHWEVIDHGDTREDLWGMEYFNGKLYVASSYFLYTLENDRLVRVEFGDDKPGSCYHVSAADGILWSIGAKDVMEFNGIEWKRILSLA